MNEKLEALYQHVRLTVKDDPDVRIPTVMDWTIKDYKKWLLLKNLISRNSDSNTLKLFNTTALSKYMNLLCYLQENP